MKKSLFSLCMFFSFFAFNQAQVPQKGERINKCFTITVVDSNEVYTWIGTDKGLFRINRKHNRKKFYDLSNTGGYNVSISDIYCLPDGCVWIATNKGLFKYDNYGFIPFTTENSNIPENLVVSVAAAKDNDLWVGTVHYGLMRMHRNRFFQSAPQGSPVITIQATLASSAEVKE